MSRIPVRMFLDLNTAHLAEVTCSRLNSYQGVVAYDMAYGWLLYVPAEPDADVDESEWPAELAPIIKLARDNSCGYVLFDRDGPTTDQLPTFDW